MGEPRARCLDRFVGLNHLLGGLSDGGHRDGGTSWHQIFFCAKFAMFRGLAVVRAGRGGRIVTGDRSI